MQVPVQAPCSTATIELATASGHAEQLLAVGTGCQEPSEIQSVLEDAGDHAVKLDRPMLSACVDQASGTQCQALKAHGGEALWLATVGWWEFGTKYIEGSFQRARSAALGGAELHDTFVQPSSFRNLRALENATDDGALLGGAVLQGPQCKGPDWDRPPGQQVSFSFPLRACLV